MRFVVAALGLTVVVLVVVLAVVVVDSDGDDSLESQIEALDTDVASVIERLDVLEQDRDSVRSTIEPIVIQSVFVSRQVPLCGTDADRQRIRYLIAGSEQGICASISSDCASETVVGEPLPRSCR